MSQMCGTATRQIVLSNITFWRQTVALVAPNTSQEQDFTYRILTASVLQVGGYYINKLELRNYVDDIT